MNTLKPNPEGLTHQPGSRDALATLWNRGAHFVLLRDNSLPAWKGWPDRRPGLDVVLQHDQPLGIVPASIDRLVVDVDSGDANRLWTTTGQPLAALPTRRGVHGYFDASPEAFNRRTFDAGYAKGDVIQGPRAYVKLHHDGDVVLAKTLGTGRHARLDLQLEMFAPAEKPRKVPEKATRTKEGTRQDIATSVILEEVLPGARYLSLYDSVRFWAYAQDRGTDYDAWIARCQSWARHERLRFRDLTDFPEAEANRIGYYIGKWVWTEYTGHRKHDHSTEAQRRRGLRSGKSRRQRMETRKALAISMKAQGYPNRDIAEVLGTTTRTVRTYLRG